MEIWHSTDGKRLKARVTIGPVFQDLGPCWLWRRREPERQVS